MEPVRAYVVDDHAVVRAGVAHTLRPPEFELVGMGACARELREVLDAGLRADVVVVDLGLPDDSGLDLVHRLRVSHPTMSTLVFTAYDDPRLELASVVSGAVGVLSKGASPEQLRDAVRRAATGEQVTTIPDILERAGRRLDAGRLRSLTVQEGRLLVLVVHGLTNQQIAELTGLAEKTVRNIVSRLLSKTGLPNRTQLTAYVLGSLNRAWSPAGHDLARPRS